MIWYEWVIIIGMFLIFIVKIYEIYSVVQNRLFYFEEKLGELKKDNDFDDYCKRGFYRRIDELRVNNRLLASKLDKYKDKVNELENENDELKDKVKCFEKIMEVFIEGVNEKWD